MSYVRGTLSSDGTEGVLAAGKNIQVGQIVYSKCGRDKDYAFIVFSVNGEFVYLVDGDIRTIDKPKKKKVKHVQIVNCVDEQIKAKIEGCSYLNDAEIRKSLKPFQKCAAV